MQSLLYIQMRGKDGGSTGNTWHEFVKLYCITSLALVYK